MTTLADKLRSEPGIDVKRLQPGTRLMVETEDAVYEMLAVRSDLELLEITSSDPALHTKTVGQLVAAAPPKSFVTQCVAGEPVLDDPEYQVPDWIGRGLCMVLRFRNGWYTSSPVTGAEVCGETWHYTVF
jgi:hypothetical protein